VCPRPERPVPIPQNYNPALALLQQPELLPDLSPEPEQKPKLQGERLIFPVARGTGRIAKKIGKKIFAIRPSETELNLAIMNGLRKQFSEERVNAIIDESFAEHCSHMPESNRPELYELYESGFIDKALERRSIRWVIGRPKRK